MKSFIDYTDNEKITLICKAIEEMRAERPPNNPDRNDDVSVFSYIESGIDLLSDEELQAIANVGIKKG